MCLFYLIPVWHSVSNEDTAFLEQQWLKSDVPVLPTWNALQSVTFEISEVLVTVLLFWENPRSVTYKDIVSLKSTYPEMEKKKHLELLFILRFNYIIFEKLPVRTGW